MARDSTWRGKKVRTHTDTAICIPRFHANLSVFVSSCVRARLCVRYERLSGDVRILHTDSLSWEAPACTGPTLPASSKDDNNNKIENFTGFVRGEWNVPRSEHSATLIGNKMYIIGGWTTSNPNMNVVDTW